MGPSLESKSKHETVPPSVWRTCTTVSVWHCNAHSVIQGARLPDIAGAAAGSHGAVLPWALRDGPRAVGNQLVPQITGKASRAVWRKTQTEERWLERGTQFVLGCLPMYMCVTGCGTDTLTRSHFKCMEKWKKKQAVSRKCKELLSYSSRTQEAEHAHQKPNYNNLNCGDLLEIFSTGDKQVGVWWVAVAANWSRNLYRPRTIPGCWGVGGNNIKNHISYKKKILNSLQIQ